MPDLQRCPRCGQLSVDVTPAEVQQVMESGPEPAEPIMVCTTRGCGWWNDPRGR